MRDKTATNENKDQKMTDAQKELVSKIKDEIIWPDGLPDAGANLRDQINKIDNVWFWTAIASATHGHSGVSMMIAAAQGNLPVDEWGKYITASPDGSIVVAKRGE
tara:strand:- start:238 stop:552 length:315 start_codon:yes stop_codon:yes gene_type:complete